MKQYNPNYFLPQKGGNMSHPVGNCPSKRGAGEEAESPAPKVIIPRIIRLPPKNYNTLRSFAESSLKPEYPWNTGVLLPMTHVAVFIKRGKWQLNVDHQGGWLMTKDGKLVLTTKGTTITVFYNSEAEDVEPETYIIPEPPVEFYIPIRLLDIIDKIKKYQEALERVIPKNEVECYGKCY
jgi:hypothetical protein